jgi:hypothetical protein
MQTLKVCTAQNKDAEAKQAYLKAKEHYSTVLGFRQKFTLGDAIAFHAFAPLEASRRGANASPLGCPLPLTGWHCTLRPNTEGSELGVQNLQYARVEVYLGNLSKREALVCMKQRDTAGMQAACTEAERAYAAARCSQASPTILCVRGCH